MGTKRTPKFAIIHSQRGAVLFIFILIFAVPIVFIGGYVGFVVEPGLVLVKNRMSQHQADYAALSLAYECAQYDDCRQSALNNPVVIHLPDWPASLAHNAHDSVFERVSLSVLQALTLSNKAQAADEENCKPPDCISGTVFSDGDGRIGARVEGSDEFEMRAIKAMTRRDADLKTMDIGYESEALVGFGGGDDIDAVDLSNVSSTFRGFTGCKKVEVSGQSTVDGLVQTAEDFTLSDSGIIDGTIIADGSIFDIDNSARIDGDIHLNARNILESDISAIFSGERTG
ncbi:MAG: hypothetical protein ACOCWF_03920, partial [Halochromatium sp.]